jgi:hypothetical protein
MGTISRRQRFPRAAYEKRIWSVLVDVGDWRDHYKRELEVQRSPALRLQLQERIKGLSEIELGLVGALRSWRGWR